MEGQLRSGRKTGPQLRFAAEACRVADGRTVGPRNSMGTTTIEQPGVGYLEAATNIVLDPLRHDLDSQAAQINKLCG
jgi:hypothetical protein